MSDGLWHSCCQDNRISRMQQAHVNATMTRRMGFFGGTGISFFFSAFLTRYEPPTAVSETGLFRCRLSWSYPRSPPPLLRSRDKPFSIEAYLFLFVPRFSRRYEPLIATGKGHKMHAFCRPSAVGVNRLHSSQRSPLIPRLVVNNPPIELLGAARMGQHAECYVALAVTPPSG